MPFYYPGVTLEQMLADYQRQYLASKGWQRSVENRTPVDAEGAPLPWLTYPAISFLTRVTRPEWRVFEYGVGASTLWWGRHTTEVHSIEHDPEWLATVAAQCPDHVHLRLAEADTAHPSVPLLDDYFSSVVEPPPPADPGVQFRAGLLSQRFRAYAAGLLAFPPAYFDAVVIDGMARCLSTWVTLKHGQPRKLIVFDNADRDFYAPAFDLLRQAGYHRIDFWGTGPINPYEWCTAVFIRDLSVLP